MDFHGINASVRTGIYSMVPLTPAFPVRKVINVSNSKTVAYADPRAWDGKPVFFYAIMKVFVPAFP